jgi:hypothetical protein
MPDPIVPFGTDFFDEKLDEGEEPEEYSQRRSHTELLENSLMIHSHFNIHTVIQKSPIVKPKEMDFLGTPDTLRI